MTYPDGDLLGIWPVTVAEAARIISDAVDPDGRQHHLRHCDRPHPRRNHESPVIATGFDRQGEDRPRPPMPQMNVTRPTPAPSLAALPINERAERRGRPRRPSSIPAAPVPFPAEK